MESQTSQRAVFFAALAGSQVHVDALSTRVLEQLSQRGFTVYGPCNAAVAFMRSEEALAYCDALVIVLSACEVSERAAYYCGIATAFSVPIVIVGGRALTLAEFSNYTYLYYDGRPESVNENELMAAINGDDE